MRGARLHYVLLGALVVALLLAGLVRRSRVRTAPNAAVPAVVPRRDAAASREATARTDPQATPAAPAAPLTVDPLEAAEGAWDQVDMDAVRAAMPDNLYWKLAADARSGAARVARAGARAVEHRVRQGPLEHRHRGRGRCLLRLPAAAFARLHRVRDPPPLELRQRAPAARSEPSRARRPHAPPAARGDPPSAGRGPGAP